MAVVARIASREVRWPIRADGFFAPELGGDRAAIIVAVWDEHGRVALGEAAPLPGRSRETLADCAASIARLDDRPQVQGPVEAFAIAAECAAGAPAARFAIETALLGLLATDAGSDLARMISDTAVRELASAVVVGDPAGARAAGDASCVKIKVGRHDPLAKVVAIANAAPTARIRIDANQQWPLDEVAARLAALRALPGVGERIELVEEPCAQLAQLAAAHPEPFALPIALDESLAGVGPDELATLLAWRAVGALVVKPTILGGVSVCARLAARAQVPAIVSHALEGPVATAACCELARALAGDRVRGEVRAAGVAAHPGLAAWTLVPPQLADSRTHVRRAPLPGLGFALDPADPFASLPR